MKLSIIARNPYTPIAACIADDKNVRIQYVGRPKRKAKESLKGMYVAKGN